MTRQTKREKESRHCYGFEKFSLAAASIVSPPKRILMLPCPGRGSEVQKAKRASGAYMLLLLGILIILFCYSLAAIQLKKAWTDKVSAPVGSHFYFTLQRPLLQASVMDDVVGWCVDRQMESIFTCEKLFSFELLFFFLIDPVSFDALYLFFLLCPGNKRQIYGSL